MIFSQLKSLHCSQSQKTNGHKRIWTLRLLVSLGEDVVQRNTSKVVSDRQVSLLANEDDLLLEAVIDAATVAIDQQVKSGLLFCGTGIGVHTCLHQLLHQRAHRTWQNDISLKVLAFNCLTKMTTADQVLTPTTKVIVQIFLMGNFWRLKLTFCIPCFGQQSKLPFDSLDLQLDSNW